jgi:hypothetical protein
MRFIMALILLMILCNARSERGAAGSKPVAQ